MAYKLSRNDQIELANMLQSDDTESIFLALSIIHNSPKPKSFAVIEINIPHKVSFTKKFDYFVRKAARKLYFENLPNEQPMIINLYNYGL